MLVPSRRLEGGDKRIATAKHKGMRPMLDVWFGDNMGRVQGNNKERRPLHKNQLPELYLSRILRCSTDAGDTVMDPCLGSGTTGVVARALGMHFIGIELEKKLLASAKARILKGPVRQV